jgi:hypothetical protein
MPLSTLRIAARLYSGASAKRGEHDATSDRGFSTLRLRERLRLHAAPEIVEHVLEEAKESGRPGDEDVAVGASYVPAPSSTKMSFFFNVGEAGEWTPDPERLSPQVAELDVARGRLLFTLAACATGEAPDASCARGGAISIHAHPSFFDDTFGARHPRVSFVSRRGADVLGVSASTSLDPYKLVARGPGVHILDVYRGPAGPYGSGPSGAMTGYRFEIVTMEESGHFGQPEPFKLAVWRGQILGTEGLAGFEDQFGSSDSSLRATRGRGPGRGRARRPWCITPFARGTGGIPRSETMSSSGARAWRTRGHSRLETTARLAARFTNVGR